MRVGIVDDEAAARADIHAALDRYAEENGVSLSVEEYPGAGAFLAARNNSYDILFLDIDMPGMSGMELAESLRLTGSAVSIIFCTNLEQFAVDGYKVSATGFLVKPVPLPAVLPSCPHRSRCRPRRALAGCREAHRHQGRGNVPGGQGLSDSLRRGAQAHSSLCGAPRWRHRGRGAQGAWDNAVC